MCENSKKFNISFIKEIFDKMITEDDISEQCAPNNQETSEDASKTFPEEFNHDLTRFFENAEWSNYNNAICEELMNKLANEIEKLKTNSKEKQIATTGYFAFIGSSIKYYAKFCDQVTKRRNGFVICKISDEINIASLGYFLGPVLAIGYKVLLVVPSELINILKLIELSATYAKFPNHTIIVIHEEVCSKQIVDSASAVFVCGHDSAVLDEKFFEIRTFPTPVIIFEDADLDSACESLIISTWYNQLPTLSLAAKEVYVQESISDKFIEKLKERISNDNDVLKSGGDYKLRTLIAKAKKMGLEVFPTEHDERLYEKYIFIGGRIILDKHDALTKCISVSSFRNFNEAISLANNNCQGLSASVWTENISIGHRTAEELMVSNVWINSTDIYHPNIMFSPRKFSGKGCFGGDQGFNQIMFKKVSVPMRHESPENYTNFENLLNVAKKEFDKWNSLGKNNRFTILKKMVNFIEEKEFKTNSVTKEWFKEWKVFLHDYMKNNFHSSSASPVKSFKLFTTYQPKGVSVIELTSDPNSHNKKLILACILEGNTVVILNDCNELQTFYHEISKQLPPNILTVVPYFNKASEISLHSPLVGVYFNEYTVLNQKGICNKFTTVCDNWADIFSKITHVKNIWINVG